MPPSTDHLERCASTLQLALTRLDSATPESPDHDLLRNAVIKSFELAIYTTTKMLRAKIKTWTPASDALTLQDILRVAGQHGLLDSDAAERWLAYRATCYNITYNHEQELAENTLQQLRDFVTDARQLVNGLAQTPRDANVS